MTISSQAKLHFPILDGLRGVAAIMVVLYHISETHATSHLDKAINHGYLAVDFFFLLSGFVIGYAYEDRWKKMTVRDFFKRRLLRLQPMVAMGMVIGMLCYYFQISAFPDIVHDVPIWKLLLAMVIGATLFPMPASGVPEWHEMHPLNPPCWSLFYEYIANILYALIIRRFSNILLAIFVFLCACLLIHIGVTTHNGDLSGGWSWSRHHIHIGMARVLYPFFAGLLLFRIGKLGRVKHAFLLSSLLVIAVLSFPRIGGTEHFWMNGLYDTLSIVLLFPLVVYIGASGELTGRFATRLCKFLGYISYPLYLVHYPFVFIYSIWVAGYKKPFSEAWPMALLLFVVSIALAYACLKWYDEPVRKWLGKRRSLQSQ
jgi:peptidoglycan/LPS O-acetylase OafA/YrhL